MNYYFYIIYIMNDSAKISSASLNQVRNEKLVTEDDSISTGKIVPKTPGGRLLSEFTTPLSGYICDVCYQYQEAG